MKIATKAQRHEGLKYIPFVSLCLCGYVAKI